ncbi:endonuclease [Celeribacter phage P12053L]|uniref:Endonuclease n=1 Tax=Celeribacter phage P12053L TaxID=1197951 RepID=I6S287_9CAUD|nr:endonuclease [Celeribacter phage P12053L]AFM54632.1 endonuclease [Celeribacter phage P12053L]
MNNKSSIRKRALKAGYRSGLEEQTAKDLKKREVPFSYEERKIKWLDSKIRTYTPDFELPNGVIVETKGRFVAADRRKHLEIKKQFGDLYDIRFVFTNSRSKLYKGAKSSYADWCNKHGFLYADKTIPEEWLNE